MYVLACKVFGKFPFELKKVAANSIDSAHSILRNIPEGYCRRSLGEYLSFLNFALGSCGEFHSCYVSCARAGQIAGEDYEALDELHYKVENGLLKLITRLQQKLRSGEEWEARFREGMPPGG